MKTSALVAFALAAALPFAALAQAPATQPQRPAAQATTPAKPAQQKVDCTKAENKAHADCKVSTTR